MFDPDGPAAQEIADLWWILVALGSVAFAIFMVALIAGLVRRRGDENDDGVGPVTLRRWVVGGGVVMPSVVLVMVMVFTVLSMVRLPSTAPAGSLRVEVVGHRWWYEIRYLDHGVVTANELHLPVDRPIELQVRSADVIHSFWVPALGGKLDMLPDHTNTLVLEANETGQHRSGCSEFCGLQHTRMRLLTIVETESEFASWVEANRANAVVPSEGLAAQGHEVFSDAGCASCHQIRGTDASGTAGPDLTHLSSRETIGAVTVEQTTESLRQWISDPHQVKQGVEMPAAELDDAAMGALLAYLESLR